MCIYLFLHKYPSHGNWSKTKKCICSQQSLHRSWLVWGLADKTQHQIQSSCAEAGGLLSLCKCSVTWQSPASPDGCGTEGRVSCTCFEKVKPVVWRWQKNQRNGKTATRRNLERLERILKEGKDRSGQKKLEGKVEMGGKRPGHWAIHPQNVQSNPQSAFCSPFAGSWHCLLSAGFFQGFTQRLWISAYNRGKLTLASPISSDIHSWFPHPTDNSRARAMWHWHAVSCSQTERDVHTSLGYLHLICNSELHVMLGVLTGAFWGHRFSEICWCLAPLPCNCLQQRGALVCDSELPWASWPVRTHKRWVSHSCSSCHFKGAE